MRLLLRERSSNSIFCGFVVVVVVAAVNGAIVAVVAGVDDDDDVLTHGTMVVAWSDETGIRSWCIDISGAMLLAAVSVLVVATVTVVASTCGGIW